MKNKAFTLIELLVVILIIAVLAAIAVPQYKKAVILAKFTKIEIVLRNIAKSMNMHYLETGTYASEWRYLPYFESPTGCDSPRYGGLMTCTLGEDYFQIRLNGDSFTVYEVLGVRIAYYASSNHWYCHGEEKNPICKNKCGQRICYFR